MQISESTNFQPDIAIKFDWRDLLKENKCHKLGRSLLEYLKPHIKILIKFRSSDLPNTSIVIRVLEFKYILYY